MENLFDDPGTMLLAKAADVAARLGERVGAASPAIRAGWSSRALLHEASASARLDEVFVEANDLLLMDQDAPDRLVDQDIQRAYQGFRLLQAVDRRHPRQLFTPRRLIAAARLRLRDRQEISGYPEWIEARRSDPTEIRMALTKALDPASLASLRAQAPLVGAARLLGLWHGSGASDLLGGAPGRALAGAWMRRDLPGLPGTSLPASGFLGHAGDYRPEPTRRWIGAYLEATLRSSAWGMALVEALRRADSRLRAEAPASRSSSRLPALIDLLISRPALSARRAADILGITPMSARRILDRLESRNLIREITGNASFRLYTAV